MLDARMGHLLLDGVFDEEKYERGMIKLLRKPPDEEDEEVRPVQAPLQEDEDRARDAVDFVEFNYTQMIGEEWLGMEAGWEEVGHSPSSPGPPHRPHARRPRPQRAAAQGRHGRQEEAHRQEVMGGR